MTINSKLIKYDASCSTFGDWAIKNKLNISKSNTPKRGDIVLFDFNHNGTSDHVGIVTGASGNTVYTVEGNTSITSNDNGGCVMKRSRTKSQINYFVRPKYTEEVTAEMVVQTALDEVGTKEKPSGSNKCKYNTWYYDREVRGSAYPWCMVFVSWCYAHVKEKETKTEPTTYKGTYPTLPTAVEKEAVRLAYAYKTAKSTYLYKGGKPKTSYKEALAKVFPNKNGWSKQCKAGASCDVFAGTVIRSCGENKDMPRGLSEQHPFLKKHFNRVSSFRSGDIMTRTNHIAIACSLKGTMFMLNAHHNSMGGTYGITQKKSGTFTKYYRPKKTSYLSKGDTFTQVKYLQEYLKWYGIDLAIDYDFGAKTEEAVKKFQSDNGLTADGVVGEKTLAKMKEINR